MRFALACVCIAMTTLVPGCQNQEQEKLQDKIDDGNVALGGQRYDTAVGDADAAMKLDANSSQAYYLRARAEEDRPKPDQGFEEADFAKAKNDFQAALNLKPEAAVAARCHAGLANIAYAQSDFETALSEWTQAVDHLDRQDWKANAMYHMALCEQRLGRFDDADRTFAQVNQQFGGTDIAANAMTERGVRGFYVTAGKYNTPADADRALNSIKVIDGSAMQIYKDGSTQIRCGPFTLYSQATDVQARIAKDFPDAVVTTVIPSVP